ncbi:MAG: hypothetical protein JWN11_1938, partial [Hyphomicrobiales bacterium]|nr:hypothetical protein [Hyphomicrobiales bacterium]
MDNAAIVSVAGGFSSAKVKSGKTARDL